MYQRRNPRPGGPASISIAHNIRTRDGHGRSVTKPINILHLGNEDTVDPDVIDGLIGQLVKVRDARRAQLAEGGVVETPKEEAVALKEHLRPVAHQLRLLCSRQLGPRMLLDVAWRELGLRQALSDALSNRIRKKVRVERMTYGMVLNRLVAPKSKLSCLAWLQDVAWMPEAKHWKPDELYRTLDHLRRGWRAVEKHLACMANKALAGEKITKVMLDTTSIFTEADMDDEARNEIAAAWREYRKDEEHGTRPDDPLPQVTNNPPLRMRGHSKDGHPHDPQVLLGLALSVDGQVLTHQIFPGNTSDKAVTPILMDQVQTLLPGVEALAVVDAGMAGKATLRDLHAKGIGWLAGTAVRNSALVDFALADTQAEWEPLTRTSHRNEKPQERTWKVKLVVIPETLRAVEEQPEAILLARNPERERRDLRKLDKEVAEVQRRLADNNSVDGSVTLHPLLRDRALKDLVRVTQDGEHIELDTDRAQKLRDTAQRQVPNDLQRVRHALAEDALAERDGKPHPLLDHRTRGWLVQRSEDGLRVELNPEAVAQAEQGRSGPLEGRIAKVVAMLGENALRVVARLSHPLLSDRRLGRYVKISVDHHHVELNEDGIAYERSRAGLRSLRTTSTGSSAEELLRASDNLLKVEDTFRSMKDVLDVRPMYHRAEPRIRAHAQICVLAQTCMHWLEQQTGRSWADLMKIFGTTHATLLSQGSREWWQRNQLSDEAIEILRKLGYRAAHEQWTSDAALTVMALSETE